MRDSLRGADGMKTRIATVQMSCTQDSDANLAKALDFARAAAGSGASIVCLPELFYTGYFLQDILGGKNDSSAAIQALEALAKENNVRIIAGMVEKEGGKIYNS